MFFLKKDNDVRARGERCCKLLSSWLAITSIFNHSSSSSQPKSKHRWGCAHCLPPPPLTEGLLTVGRYWRRKNILLWGWVTDKFPVFRWMIGWSHMHAHMDRHNWTECIIKRQMKGERGRENSKIMNYEVVRGTYWRGAGERNESWK